ncbi:MAG: ribosome recycling factor [Gammaproteobacteria bacterium]|nr:ribosome recycling factor [Gammaproteobacteria bacterium]
MIEEIKQDASQRMEKSIESFRDTLVKLRTGRANPSLLDQVMIPYYGSNVPLSQAATVSVADARMLNVTPWEKDLVPVIEKAIMASGLGLNPSTSGSVIRIALPPLTEERRRDMVKIVKAEAENARISLRNIRRDANGDFKELLKEKEITEDEERRAEDDIQKITDKFVAQVEKITEEKEADLLEV